MAIPILFIAILLIVTGVRDTYGQLGQQLAKDAPDFLLWLAAVLIVGFVGYFQPWQTASRAILALIIIVYVTRSGGLFNQIQSAIQTGARSAGGPETPVPTVIPIEASGNLPIELKSPGESKPIDIKIVQQGGGGGGAGGMPGM